MKLSTRARYALRMMADIAQNTTSDGNAVSLTEVSKRTKISRRYLEQLTIALRSNSLLRGKTGKGGGYKLARPADKIQVAQIIEAAIGPIDIVDCVLDPDTCDMSSHCGCRDIYKKINNRIVETLSDLTLKDLVTSNSSTVTATAKSQRSPKECSNRNNR
jgi:Rrf2 family iron-sulfur cluster assembly transcriptional regulator